MAILTRSGPAMPKCGIISVITGTMMMPPPMPNSPENKPEMAPKAISAANRDGFRAAPLAAAMRIARRPGLARHPS
jgi:hypothetical protein